jgi:hypothetical protein
MGLILTKLSEIQPVTANGPVHNIANLRLAFCPSRTTLGEK